MNFHPNISSLAQQQSSGMFDPDSWRKPYGHLPAQTFAANAQLNSHYGAVYPTNALGLTSDVPEVNRDSDRIPNQTGGGYFFHDGVVQPDPYLAQSYYPSNNAVAAEQHYIDEMAVAYNNEGQAAHYPSGYCDTSSSIAGDRYWQFSPMQQEPEHYPSHSYSFPSHSGHLSSTQHVTNSYSSTLPQVHNYQTAVVPHINQSMYQPHTSHVVHQQQRTPQLPQSASRHAHGVQQSHGASMDTTWPDSIAIPDTKRRSPSSLSPNAPDSRTSSPNRRKLQIFGWPRAERTPQRASSDVLATGPSSSSSGTRALESSTPTRHPTTPSPVSRGSSSERVAAAATTGRQRATESSPTGATQQSVLKLPATTKKSTADRKQTLACLFCRERKIACGRPPEGSPDDTCNQCARRHFKCEYPKESRRGQHKRNKKKSHDVNDAK